MPSHSPARGRVDPLTEYIAELQERIEDRGRDGDARGVGFYSRVVEELEDLRRQSATEAPSLRDAARVSGYSTDRLRQLRKTGQWSGTWSDLPRRPNASRLIHNLQQPQDAK